MATYRIPPSMISKRTYFGDDEGNVINRKGEALKPDFSPGKAAYTKGSVHPIVNIAGKKHNIHRLICAARWGLPRKGQECHHLNGNKFDNRPMNLIWLDHDRHMHYDRRMRAVRKVVGRGIMLFERKDFIRWAMMGERRFTKMLTKLKPAPHGTVLPDCEQEPLRDN